MRQSKQPTNTVRRYRQIFSVYMYACVYLCMSAEAVGLGATDDGWVGMGTLGIRLFSPGVGR